MKTLTYLKSLVLFSFIFFCAIKGQASNGQHQSDSLKNLTLVDLLGLDVSTGSLLKIDGKETPVAITTITKEDIEITQARNLAALIEIYVPGLMLMEHSETAIIGIRGQIAAENYKILLLVNGVNITNMVYGGVMTEIDLWDLNDIERVEVVRGPGSVTYGTGAMAGVINIITKSDLEDKKANVNIKSDPVYRSHGVSAQYSKKLNNSKFFIHGGVTKTLGNEDTKFYIPKFDLDEDNRYVGFRSSDNTGPQDYLADGLNRPQVKLQTEYQKGEHFKIWSRYTQSGQHRSFTTKQIELNSEGDSIGLSNRRTVGLRSFILASSFDKAIGKGLKLETNASLTSQEYLRQDFKNSTYSNSHYNNTKDYIFSQDRLNGQTLLNWEPNQKLNIVSGLEYDFMNVGAPWFKSADYLWIREGVNLVNDTSTNIYSQDPNSQYQSSKGVEEIGNGINVNTFSFLFEGNYKFNESTSILASGRLDKPNISTFLFSPRLALVHKFNEENTIKLNAQRSLRMMPIRAQYLYHKNYKDSTDHNYNNEVMNAIELSYTRISNENFLFNVNTFYNDLFLVGYTGKDLQFIGQQQLAGVEIEIQLKNKKTNLVFNHSLTQQIKFDGNDDLLDGSNRNNITYADYLLFTRGDHSLTLNSYGNGINNWSNNSSRLAFTHKSLQNNLIFHANSRVFWDYKGSWDEMLMYQEAYDNFDVSVLDAGELVTFNEQKADFEHERFLLEEQFAFQLDARINASISYSWDINAKYQLLTTIYADNLIGSQKRYYVSTGSNNPYPDRLRFMEEPRTVGVKLKMNFF